MVWPPEVQLELNCILPGSPVAVSIETPVLREGGCSPSPLSLGKHEGIACCCICHPVCLVIGLHYRVADKTECYLSVRLSDKQVKSKNSLIV